MFVFVDIGESSAVGQDISDRALQFAAKPPHFDLGKSRDTYGPTGPVLVSTDSFANPDDLALTCHVNGEQRQGDRTSNLIFGVPALIAYLSSILTLEPGDLIFTGTPDGVGAASRNFLKPGDVIVEYQGKSVDKSSDLPSLVAATPIGQSEAMFRTIVLSLLTASGVALLVSSVPAIIGRL